MSTATMTHRLAIMMAHVGWHRHVGGSTWALMDGTATQRRAFDTRKAWDALTNVARS